MEAEDKLVWYYFKQNYRHRTFALVDKILFKKENGATRIELSLFVADLWAESNLKMKQFNNHFEGTLCNHQSEHIGVNNQYSEAEGLFCGPLSPIW